jgi:RNA polymerase sigma-70 factor (ECF subfamily)
MIYHVAYRVTGNVEDAEELMQETFMTVFGEARSFEGRSQVTTWLTRIALNKSINLAKQRQGRRSLLQRWFGSTRQSSPPPEPDAAQGLLDRVAPNHRAILTLRYILGYSHEEIAKAMDCPVGTAKSRLFQAHLEIRRSLEQRGRDE